MAGGVRLRFLTAVINAKEEEEDDDEIRLAFMLSGYVWFASVAF